MDDIIWAEKYRPKTIAETILPEKIKSTFQQFVNKKNVPNLLLTGRAGIGKTTVAKAMLNEIGANFIVINGSMNGNIDTLRNEILNFASTVSFIPGVRKYVILDEADYLNAQSTQPALRNFMEEFSKNCGFILTCNYKNRIIEPLHSRCSVVDFTIESENKPKLALEFFKRTCEILTKEKIKFDERAVSEVITEHFPDWRRVLNELQLYSATGVIDTGILANISDESMTILFDAMKKKDFTVVRKWVADHADMDSAVLYKKLYDKLTPILKSNSASAAAIIIMAEYQYKEAFVANSEINRVACLATIMVEADWK